MSEIGFAEGLIMDLIKTRTISYGQTPKTMRRASKYSWRNSKDAGTSSGKRGRRKYSSAGTSTAS